MLTPIPPAGACPDDEQLAAFLDDGLSPPERAVVVAHLASCALCRETVAGTARVMDDLGEAGGARRRAPGRRLSVLQPWLSAAAALLLGVTGAAYWNLRPRELTETDLVQALRGQRGPLAHFWTAGVVRGSPDADQPLSVRSFGLGATLLDLRVAFEAGDAARAGERLQLIVVRLAGLDFMEQEAGLFAAARERVRTADELPRIAVEVAALEPRLEARLDRRWLALGRWAEAGRLAAASRLPGFFSRAENRRFVRWVRSSLADELRADVASDLSAIESAWPEKGPADEAQLGRLDACFARLMARFDVPR
jgi:hypothetical protein